MHTKDLKKQAKFLTYVLGVRPDEFGLVPDQDGYVKIKEFLKAVHEEEGWRSFRQGNINEMLVSLPNPPIQVNENFIRVKDRQRLPQRTALQAHPKLLFTCIRPKALRVIYEKGVGPMGRNHVILSSDKGMAQRIGKRVHASPATLTVNVESAVKKGTLFLQAGENLFLARYLPPDCFTGPPLPKEPQVTKAKEPERIKERDRTPGSFFPDINEQMAPKEPKKLTRKQRREKDIGWKKSRKQKRRR